MSLPNNMGNTGGAGNPGTCLPAYLLEDATRCEAQACTAQAGRGEGGVGGVEV